MPDSVAVPDRVTEWIEFAGIIAGDAIEVKATPVVLSGVHLR